MQIVFLYENILQRFYCKGYGHVVLRLNGAAMVVS